MDLPQPLLERLKQNEKIAKKFYEIEASILSILNFQDFLEKLLREISEKFNVPHTWISIIRESSIADQLIDIQNSTLLKSSTAFVSRQSFSRMTRNRVSPLLANTDLEKFKDLIPESFGRSIGSISIAPITLDGEIVGSINQADSDRHRFEPGIDTSLLEQLALKVSLCLSNVTAHEQLKFLAFHDPLTGLLNRGVMERILEREFQRAKRYGMDLSLLFLDLDDFKSINDTYGHDTGDRALCHVADCLTRLKRDSDIVARFAGDEFVVILPSTTEIQAEYYINRVKQTLATSPLSRESADPSPIHVRLSHGISSVPNKSVQSSKSLLKEADKKLYNAKKNKSPKKSGV
ncbi:diguanylate cyclase [Desulfospira joergensenii]|uniref:diguanylate cyclase n=1 Tax=Desulfospira joergensenii TaxID=53329 RepID=UPI0003B64332|nr:DUF484 family protein [Desulfospira joergensenii]